MNSNNSNCMRKSKIEAILSKSEHCEPIYQDDIITAP